MIFAVSKFRASCREYWSDRAYVTTGGYQWYGSVRHRCTAMGRSVTALWAPKAYSAVDTQAMTLFSILSNTHQTTKGLSSSRILQNFRQPLQPFVEGSHLKPHILLSRRNGAQCPSTPSSPSLRVSDRYLFEFANAIFQISSESGSAVLTWARTQVILLDSSGLQRTPRASKSQSCVHCSLVAAAVNGDRSRGSNDIPSVLLTSRGRH